MNNSVSFWKIQKDLSMESRIGIFNFSEWTSQSKHLVDCISIGPGERPG